MCVCTLIYIHIPYTYTFYAFLLLTFIACFYSLLSFHWFIQNIYLYHCFYLFTNKTKFESIFRQLGIDELRHLIA